MSKRNVYKGHRYVPKIMGKWNQEETYEGLSIVTNKGTSYTSKKRVPVGIDILDEEYWVVTGNYNAQVENYRQEVREFDNRISENTLDINTNKLNIEIKADKTDVKEINQQLLTKADIKDVEEINQQLLTKASQDDLIDVIDNLSEVIDDQHQFKNESETALGQLQVEKKNKMRNIIYLSDFPKLPNEKDDEHINRALQNLDGSGFGSDYPSKEGTLILEGKEYVLHKPIRLYKHQHLKGSGHGTVLNGDLISTNIIERIKDSSENHIYGGSIERLTIMGNYNNTGIHLKTSTHYQIRDVYIYNTQWGIWAENSWLATFERITIRNDHVKQGELGFYIGGGTSNVLTNVWVKSFDKGFNTASMYTTFNSCACDSFVDYAYYNRQSTTLNGCGAEDGNLKEGSFVFGSLNRGVVYNACETLGMYYNGKKNGACFFKVVGGKVVNNSFRVGGTIVSSNMAIYSLESDAYVQDFNTVANSNAYTKHYFVPDKASASVVMEWYGALFAFHRWNGSNVLNGG